MCSAEQKQSFNKTNLIDLVFILTTEYISYIINNWYYNKSHDWTKKVSFIIANILLNLYVFMSSLFMFCKNHSNYTIKVKLTNNK